MQLSRYLLLLLLGFSTTLSSCDKDITELPSSSTIVSLELVKASFSGTVTGKVRGIENQGVESAKITIGTATTETDAEGKWRIENVLVPKDRAFIKAFHSSYLHGSKTISVSNESSYQIDIQLLIRGRVGAVGAATGGSIMLSNEKVSLTFPPNVFVNLDGSTYDGQVIVYAQHIDPTTNKGFSTMPGDLIGLTKNVENVALESYGMLGVELRSEGGSQVQLAPESTATIRLEIPTSLLANAPSSIPLWYFDEEIGVWKEEGQAELLGSRYVGEVKHFTWWNYDEPFDLVRICGEFVNDQGAPLVGTAYIKSQNYGTRSIVTNGIGEFCGFVPAAENLTLTVFNICEDSTVIDLGSLTVDTDLGEILQEGTTQNTFFTGRLTNCSGTPVAGVTIGVQRQSGSPFKEQGLTNQNGEFSVEILTCNTVDDSLRLVFLNVSSVQAQRTSFFSVPQGNDLGIYEMCSSTQYATFMSTTLEDDIFFCPGTPQIIYNTSNNNGLGRFEFSIYGCVANSGLVSNPNFLSRTVSNMQHVFDEGIYSLSDTSASDAIGLETTLRFNSSNNIQRMNTWQSGQVEILRTPRFYRDTFIQRTNAIGILPTSGDTTSLKFLTRGISLGQF